jgi:hypothetical protein
MINKRKCHSELASESQYKIKTNIFILLGFLLLFSSCFQILHPHVYYNNIDRSEKRELINLYKKLFRKQIDSISKLDTSWGGQLVKLISISKYTEFKNDSIIDNYEVEYSTTDGDGIDKIFVFDNKYKFKKEYGMIIMRHYKIGKEPH